MERSLSNIFSLALLLCSTALAGDDPLFRIKEGDKWGFINRSGDVVIKPEYDDCYYQFSEGLAAVKANGKWGYIDSANRMRIAPRFDSARSFEGGMAAVSVGQPVEGEGKWGYIDLSGRYLFEQTNALSCGGFNDGLMPVGSGDKWGYLNTKGEWAIPSRFSYAYDFSEGLAGVRAADSTAGFIDPDGNWVIRLNGAVPLYPGFAEGLAPVHDQKTGKIGYIDRNGGWKILPKFSNAREFSQGRAAVQILSKDVTGWPVRKWGVINRNGELIAQAKYDAVWSYKEGFINVLDDDKWGYLDLEGNLAIPCRFDVVEPFENGLAYVTVGDRDQATDWSGYINRHGEYVWRPSDFDARDKARREKARLEQQKKAAPTITILSDSKSDKEGLLVTCPSRIPFKGENAGKVPILVSNLLDEEVFLEIAGSDSLGYSLHHWDGGFSGGGGGRTIFPDNSNLLKRLHPSSYRDGERSTCGCCFARINGRLAPDVLSIGRARGTVTVWISGFYRSSGKRFSEPVDLPIELVEQADDQQDEAGQPASRPLSNSKGSDKLQPESEDRSR